MKRKPIIAGAAALETAGINRVLVHFAWRNKVGFLSGVAIPRSDDTVRQPALITGLFLVDEHVDDAQLLQTGHRIVLQVSSSTFPRFNRNVDTGEATAGATGMTKADQTIYRDAERPSALVLPLIPR